MAEVLAANQWAAADPLGMHLRGALPDEYVIATDPVVHGRVLDAVVVGPQGLFVLHCKGWEGEVHPARRGPWREQLEEGREVRHPNPAEETRQATKALRAFLRDEFPSLHPVIHHLLVLTRPGVRLTASAATELPVVTTGTVAEAIESTETPPSGDLPDSKVREGLALALCDRRRTASQRASEPFVFRSGGLFGSGKKARTIRAAVRHMDKHPADGIFHLRNGTLARWLSEQGAEHLAELAREAMGQRETDPRIPLETFLIGTGLVRRPRLSLWPRRINLGYVLSGESSDCRLRVRKGPGRGYLFGTLRTSEPWLRVEPRTIRGRSFRAVVSADTEKSLEAVVSANTQSLPISQEPWGAAIYIESSASEEPVAIPVRVRVVGMPSRLNRSLLRPLAGSISAGLLGAGIGWALGHWGMQAPGWLAELTSRQISSATAWAIFIGLFWALLGWIRGLLQHIAWPTAYATRRWLFRTLAWGAALSLLAGAGYWSFGQLDPDLSTSILDSTGVSVILFALALAILPAVLGEIRSARPAKTIPVRSARWRLLRPLLLAAIGIALALALVAGVQVIGPAWQQFEVKGTLSTAQQWAGDRWAQLEVGVNDFVDQLYIRYYDRRAPVQATPTPTPAPTASPTTESGMP